HSSNKYNCISGNVNFYFKKCPIFFYSLPLNIIPSKAIGLDFFLVIIYLALNVDLKDIKKNIVLLVTLPRKILKNSFCLHAIQMKTTLQGFFTKTLINLKKIFP